MATKNIHKPAEPKAPAGPFAKKVHGVVKSGAPAMNPPVAPKSIPLKDKKIYKPSDVRYTPPGMPGPNRPPVPFAPKSRRAKLPK